MFLGAVGQGMALDGLVYDGWVGDYINIYRMSVR